MRVTLWAAMTTTCLKQLSTSPMLAHAARPSGGQERKQVKRSLWLQTSELTQWEALTQMNLTYLLEYRLAVILAVCAVHQLKTDCISCLNNSLNHSG